MVVQVCFMAQNVVCLSECYMELEKNVSNLPLLDEIVYRCQLFGAVNTFNYVPYWFSAFWICVLLTEGSSGRGFICFSLNFYQFLPHVFWCSFVGCTEECYVFLEYWPLYHCVCYFLSVVIFLVLKSSLSEINIATYTVFRWVLACCIFLRLL